MNKRILATLVILPLAGLVLMAVAMAAPAKSAGGANLIKNGDFEQVTNDKPNGWQYQKQWAGKAKWGVDASIRKGKKSLFLISENSGTHGGIMQKLRLRPKTKYKFSAWIRATLQADAKVQYPHCACEQTVKGKKQRWESPKTAITRSTDWRYVESIFQTPAKIVKNKGWLMPFLFQGKGRVWVSDVKLIVLGPADLGKATFSSDFSDVKKWKVSCHQDEKPAKLVDGIALSKATVDKKSCAKLDYKFTTPKHDAVMLSTKANVASGEVLSIEVCSDGSKHEFFVVLMDKNGESHYLPVTKLSWKGWRTLYVPFSTLFKTPDIRSVSATHWGGDGSQVLEFPITGITVGINDKPDSFKGNGSLWLGKIQIFEKKK